MSVAAGLCHLAVFPSSFAFSGRDRLGLTGSCSDSRRVTAGSDGCHEDVHAAELDDEFDAE